VAEGVFMAATNPSLESEVEELVLEQIPVFKQSAAMDDFDIFEYHLRPNRSWFFTGN
jgi:hypothetical protein